MPMGKMVKIDANEHRRLERYINLIEKMEEHLFDIKRERDILSRQLNKQSIPSWASYDDPLPMKI
jgi:hypothetical protein